MTKAAWYLSSLPEKRWFDCVVLLQLTSPVQWQKTMDTLLSKGLERSVEVGPNKVIAGIMKRINKEHEIENVSA